MKYGKKFRRWCIYKSIKFFEFIVCLLPLSMMRNIGGKIGLVIYYCLAKERKIALNNLRTSFPEKSLKECKIIAKEVFVNQGKNFCELLSFSKLKKEEILNLVEAEGLEHIDKALSDGNGVILLAGHIGNWELMGAYLASKGYPINVIARRIYDERLNKILVDLRSSKGVKTILREGSTKGILRCLKQRETIGMLIDQDTSRVQGVYVDFFGHQAYTPIGAAVLARRDNVTVLPVFIVRKGKKHYLSVEHPVELIKTGDKEQEIRENTQKFTKIIESWIRNYPGQWVWTHRRWKSKPADIFTS